MTETNLYERLGGETRIRELANTIFDKHTQNATILNRYVDSDRDDVIRLVTEFICNGTGGPQAYTGRDMLTTHRGMNINEEEFVAVVDDIVEALDEHGVGQREKEELLMISWSLKPEIVRV
ncbi:group 1 truncated hemoglobin [Thioalkalivibrio sp. ALMg11]|uniref:group I truncated hemoglobin n=1 Tax=Thioalkalivibrio sp. ALMg11 TaxID=1158165 RepID=UPI00035FAD39|nr:group 1 truncated hemoglobin [Thioalkalivibrio sp. ALMg11]